VNWGFARYRLEPDIQRGSWLSIDGAFDATTPDREIDDAALSADQPMEENELQNFAQANCGSFTLMP